MTSQPITINALVLQATPGRGRVWILQCFSEQLGRIAFCAIPKRGGSFSPFCRIEATITFQGNDFAAGRDTDILDTFSEMRCHPGASKSALFIRAIIEKCLPMHAPSSDVWGLTLSLFHLLPTFSDWKAAPLMLALTFFEHEGVSPLSITECSLLSEEGRVAAHYLLEADEAAWRKAQIPEDLFIAAMETIGIDPNTLKNSFLP
jgi:recombinational DNA repair protein (RecF pathway)